MHYLNNLILAVSKKFELCVKIPGVDDALITDYLLANLDRRIIIFDSVTTSL